MNKPKSYLEVTNGGKKSMLVEVEVLDYVKEFGNDRAIIRPMAGEGRITVMADKVIVKKQ